MAIDDFNHDLEALRLAGRLDVMFEVLKTQTEIMREILRAMSEVRTKTTLILELMLDEAECEACQDGDSDGEDGDGGRVQ